MRYFFDTNIIIDIFDKKLETITKLKEIYQPFKEYLKE